MSPLFIYTDTIKQERSLDNNSSPFTLGKCQPPAPEHKWGHGETSYAPSHKWGHGETSCAPSTWLTPSTYARMHWRGIAPDEDTAQEVADGSLASAVRTGSLCVSWQTCHLSISRSDYLTSSCLWNLSWAQWESSYPWRCGTYLSVNTNLVIFLSEPKGWMC